MKTEDLESRFDAGEAIVDFLDLSKGRRPGQTGWRTRQETYGEIADNIHSILQAIEPDHVSEYDWLMAHIQDVGTEQYQKRYRQYWRMNSARLSQEYCATYFGVLQAHLTSPRDLTDITLELYETPTYRSGRRSLQFVFATKLFHMANRHSPIYDSSIATFYGFSTPGPWLVLDRRLANLIAFYEFLRDEYQRVLTLKLLDQPINAFRRYFQPQCFSDEKIIDSLLWAYVARR